MSKSKGFFHWFFEKKDIDTLIVAFMVSAAVGSFIKDLSNAIINPIMTAILPTNNEDEQIININNKIIFKFKLQLLLSGLIKLLTTLYIAYLIVKHIFQRFAN
jgi:large-conductance mechanosensitive channel